MIKQCAITLWLLLLTFHCFSKPAYSEEVHWAINEIPPFHIGTGPYRGRGVCDAVINAVMTSLTDFTHTKTTLPGLRATIMMREQQAKLCFPCAIQQANDSEIIYSKATHQYAPHGVITRSDLAARLVRRHGQPISLTALAQDLDFTFAQPLGRRFGVLQPIIDDYLVDSRRYVTVAGETASDNVLAMLRSERVDYTIDYQMVMEYWLEQTPRHLAFIPIQENYNQQLFGAIACPNNEWGKQVIDAVDANIEAIRNDPNLIQTQQFWLSSPANTIELLPDSL
ncbi:hypothetical protein [Pseudidiomarina taiwanensis]|uniref:hypothetical protein n=1 Tax=Pseudidiomarina taiwanensis TaxID=337250 RepID=UPI000F87C9FD|nr:hypothetical protein [Pseudidiomarina taiwanensis]